MGLILLIAALVCLVLAAFNVGAPRVHLGWLGLAFYVAAALVGGATLDL